MCEVNRVIFKNCTHNEVKQDYYIFSTFIYTCTGLFSVFRLIHSTGKGTSHPIQRLNCTINLLLWWKNWLAQSTLLIRIWFLTLCSKDHITSCRATCLSEYKSERSNLLDRSAQSKTSDCSVPHWLYWMSKWAKGQSGLCVWSAHTLYRYKGPYESPDDKILTQ